MKCADSESKRDDQRDSKRDNNRKRSRKSKHGHGQGQGPSPASAGQHAAYCRPYLRTLSVSVVLAMRKARALRVMLPSCRSSSAAMRLRS